MPLNVGGWYRLTAQNLEYVTNIVKARATADFQVAVPLPTVGGPAAQATFDQKRLATAKGTGSVQLATGAEATSRNLFSFAGARDWNFEIHYNSVLAAAQTNPGALGFGWTHNFESRLEISSSQLVLHSDAVSANTFTLVSGSTTTYSSTEDGAQYDTITAQPDGTWLLVCSDQSQRRFDATGLFVEDRDPHGRRLVLSYANGSLAQIKDPISGTQLSFTTDPTTGAITSATDALGASVTFTYGGANHVLTGITNQNGKKVTFGYGQTTATAALILTLTDDEGHVLTTNTYDGQGRVVTQQEGSGQFSFGYTVDQFARTVEHDRTNAGWSYAFDINGNMLVATDPLGFSKNYGYDSHNRPINVSDELGRTTNYTYDANGNLLTTKDPAGKVTTFTYDGRNNLLTVVDALGNTTTRTYDAANNLLSITDALGRTTRWTYDQNSLPLTMTLPGGGVYQYTYTAGLLTQTTDPNGVTTKFGYDANGRMLYQEDALGKRTTFTYDAIGNVLTRTNPLNDATTFGYDYRNRLLSVTDPTGAKTTFTYDSDNRVLTSTDALGNTTTYSYDAEGRLTATTNAANETVQRTYNTVGRLVSITDNAGKTTNFEYDAAGHLTAEVDALGKRTINAYDVRSLLTTTTDPMHEVTQHTYDDLGRLISNIDPLYRVTQYQYDAVGRLAQVVSPGGLTATAQFDVDGNRTGVTNPSSNTTAFGYDSGGRLTAMTTAEGHASAMTYDSRGLLSSVTPPSGSVTVMGYDDVGRVNMVTDALGTIAYARDGAGRITTVTENGKTLTRGYDVAGRLTSFTDYYGDTIGYAYDNVGRLTQLTYPGGKQVTYGYDAAGRLSTVTDWANRTTTYNYDANGRMTSLLRPNGTKQVRTYDDVGRLVQFREYGPDGVTVLYSGDYTYSFASQLTAETVNPPVMPSASSAIQTFDRDNRLLTHNGAAVTFDANGNMLSIAAGVTPDTYTYDARNRLTSAGALSYTYDAENRRVAIGSSTSTTHFTVNPNASPDQVLVRTAADGTKTYYVYGLGLLHEECGADIRYYHASPRGDTVILSDGSGIVTDRIGYGAYGEVTSRTGTTDTPFLFNGFWGVQTDPNGLFYHRARYYHPTLKRFVNQDSILGTITTPASLNRFAYANGDPISLVDPHGSMAQDVDPNRSDCASLESLRDNITARLRANRSAITRANGDLITAINGPAEGSTFDPLQLAISNGVANVDADAAIATQYAGIAGTFLDVLEKNNTLSGNVFVGFGIAGIGNDAGHSLVLFGEGQYADAISRSSNATLGFTMLVLPKIVESGAIESVGPKFAKGFVKAGGPLVAVAQVGILAGQEAQSYFAYKKDITESQDTIENMLDRSNNLMAQLTSVAADLKSKGCQ